jgi:hypothetical protein
MDRERDPGLHPLLDEFLDAELQLIDAGGHVEAADVRRLPVPVFKADDEVAAERVGERGDVLEHLLVLPHAVFLVRVG